jgi:UDP-glucuronate 4-epimerase
VDHPISPYAASKKAGELLCHTWHHLWGISILCLRFFTVFGPRQRPDLAIHKFATLLKAGKPLPVYGDGSSSRDYTYIDDTVTGIVAALELTGKTSVYDVINLGNDQSVSLERMVHGLERVSGIKALRQQLPPQDGDVLHTRADISKAARLLGYNPQTSFEQGLEHFWRWFDQQSE